MKLNIIDQRKHYIDSLEVWIEVPVWDQSDLIKYVNEIDFEELPLEDYQKLLVDHWPGLPQVIKAKLKNPTVRNELYEVLIHENWGLLPSDKKAPDAPPYYSEVQEGNVRSWFESRGVQGRRPEVIGGSALSASG